MEVVLQDGTVADDLPGEAAIFVVGSEQDQVYLFGVWFGLADEGVLEVE